MEKVVRYIDELSSKGAISWSQGHHQHHHYHHGDKGSKKLKNDDDDANDNMLSKSLNEKNGKNDDGMIGEEHAQHDAHLRYVKSLFLNNNFLYSFNFLCYLCILFLLP